MSTLVSDRSCPRPSDQSALVTSQGRRQQSFPKLANNPLFNKQTQNLHNFQSILFPFFMFEGERVVCKLGLRTFFTWFRTLLPLALPHHQ